MPPIREMRFADRRLGPSPTIANARYRDDGADKAGSKGHGLFDLGGAYHDDDEFADDDGNSLAIRPGRAHLGGYGFQGRRRLLSGRILVALLALGSLAAVVFGFGLFGVHASLKHQDSKQKAPESLHDAVKVRPHQQHVIAAAPPAAAKVHTPAPAHKQSHLQPRQVQEKAASKLCTTPECVSLSHTILQNLSPNYKDMNPCDDFNEYVCGGWPEHHDLRADQSSVSTSSVMDEEGHMLLRRILESKTPPTSKNSESQSQVNLENFQRLQTTYQACMNEARLLEVGVKPIQVLIDSAMAIYPGNAVTMHKRDNSSYVVDDVNDSGAPALGKILGWLDDQGVGTLVRIGTTVDDTNPDVVVLGAYTATPVGLPAKEQYNDPKVYNSYVKTIGDMLEIMITDKLASSIFKGKKFADIATSIGEFEKLVASKLPRTEDENDVTKYYNVRKLADLDTMVPSLQLSKIFKDRMPKNVTSDRVIVSSPEFMANISKIIDETPKETLAGYFAWKIIQSFTPYVARDLVKPYIHFSNQLAGQDPDTKPERWRTCLNYVSGRLGWVLSAYYVEKRFSTAAKDEGNRVVRDIRAQYVKILQNADWMDKETTAKAIEKVNKIGQKIGFPDKSPNILDPQDLRKWYADVDATEDHFANLVSSRHHSNKKDWNSLSKPVDRNEWSMTASEINAYYSPNGNEIVFPAGIMQPPVFNAEYPSYINFGAFGSVSGHELSHGFDNSGRHYDQNGNYTDWWDPKTVAAFDQKTKCFVDQYSKYSVPGPDGNSTLNVNGQLTLGENLADIGGVRASFAAWMERQKTSRSVEASLPGLEDFTHAQMFFLSYGNWWCSKSRPQYQRLLIYSDPHSPNWARILGTTANSKEFLEAFNCPVKEPKCTLW